MSNKYTQLTIQRPLLYTPGSMLFDGWGNAVPPHVSRAPLSLFESKRLLNRPLEAELERAFQNEIEDIMRCFITEDAHEATVAFREKRPAVFKGK